MTMSTITRREHVLLGVFGTTAAIFLATAGVFSYIIHKSDLQGAPAHALSGDISWKVFDGGADDPGTNYSESIITTGNASRLAQLWKTGLPATADNAVVELPNVSTSAGTVDLVFVNTVKGNLIAFNADTGAKVWEDDPSSANYNGQGTKSTPAIDASGTYVYAYALDGYVHRYRVTDGAEVAGTGFPAQVTLLPNDTEKGSASINIAGGYLYMTLSGNDGDYGHYVGHVVAVNLATGAKSVWNAECANIAQLLYTSGPNYCANTMSGIWARPGVKVDPVTGNVFVATGNGNYNANSGGNNWGDSILELSPSLGTIVDSYTPASYSSLDSGDADLGSTAPVILPTQSGSNTPYMLVQAGKDAIVRLLNRSNLSGQGGPRHTGGELQTIGINNEVHEQPAVWTDGGGTTWVFVTDESGYLYAYKVVTAGGVSSLSQVYQKSIGAISSPFVANGVLYLDGNNLLALNATTGATLFNSSSIGVSLSQHWESPIVVNGLVFTPDNRSNLLALYIPGVTPVSAPPAPSPTPSPASSGSSSTAKTTTAGTAATAAAQSNTPAGTSATAKSAAATAAASGVAASAGTVKHPAGLVGLIETVGSAAERLLHLQPVAHFVKKEPVAGQWATIALLALLALLVWNSIVGGMYMLIRRWAPVRAATAATGTNLKMSIPMYAGMRRWTQAALGILRKRP